MKPIVLLNGKEHTHVHCCVHSCCVINECHACGGTDFRKAFGRIGGLRALTKCPFMSLTASAPPTIESSIKSSLALVSPAMVSQPLDRSNIYMSVGKKIFYGCKFVISTWYNRLLTLISFQGDFSGVAASLKACSDLVSCASLSYEKIEKGSGQKGRTTLSPRSISNVTNQIAEWQSHDRLECIIDMQ